MPELFQDLLLAALITWRLAVLIVEESGPFDIISRFQNLVGEIYTWDGETETKGFRPAWPIIGGAVACVGCLSLWMAPLALLVVREAPEDVGLVLATWAAATLTHKALS